MKNQLIADVIKKERIVFPDPLITLYSAIFIAEFRSVHISVRGVINYASIYKLIQQCINIYKRDLVTDNVTVSLLPDTIKKQEAD